MAQRFKHWPEVGTSGYIRRRKAKTMLSQIEGWGRPSQRSIPARTLHTLLLLLYATEALAGEARRLLHEGVDFNGKQFSSIAIGSIIR